MIDAPTPVDTWLHRQQDLTAVERFALHHDGARARGLPAASERWIDRLPALPPGPGQQYAFAVDLDACTGCKACVTACHSLNGTDDGEAWRRVGSLHADDATTVGSATVTSACHHCVEPACLQGCPAAAYVKDPVTGIVRHLDDACIGCSYCTLTCPYEVPVYNPSLGIVRKCDLCSDRLAVGEAPACVQGCPQGAITITVAATDALVAACAGEDARLVPTAPPSSLTVPSTRYTSSRPIPATLVAADRSSVHPSPGHAPLAVMLVLTQAAVGMAAAAAWLRAAGASPPGTATPLAAVAIATGLIALGASVLHLGRPMLAWRAVLGLRRSWLSREVLAFGAFAGAGVAQLVLRAASGADGLVHLAEGVAVVGGLVGVACSAQLYAVTGRPWWRLAVTVPRFAGTVLAGGALGTAVVLALAAPAGAGHRLGGLLALAVAGIVLSTAAPLVPLWRCGRRPGGAAELAGTRRLLASRLAGRQQARVACAATGCLVVALAAAASRSPIGGSHRLGAALAVAWLLTMVGELQDRRLFFLASVAPRMPGSPR